MLSVRGGSNAKKHTVFPVPVSPTRSTGSFRATHTASLSSTFKATDVQANAGLDKEEDGDVVCMLSKEGLTTF